MDDLLPFVSSLADHLHLRGLFEKRQGRVTDREFLSVLVENLRSIQSRGWGSTPAELDVLVRDVEHQLLQPYVPYVVTPGVKRITQEIAAETTQRVPIVGRPPSKPGNKE